MKDVHIILGAPKEEPIKPLIQSEGIVIGVDRGSRLAVEENIHLDVALGDFDSVNKKDKERITNSSRDLLEYPSDKDDTDLELALLYVLENYPKATIYIYNWYGGRADHLYSILLLVLQKRFEELVPYINLVTSDNLISYYLPGNHTVEKIEGMDYLSYILLSEVRGLTLENVKYPLQEADFQRPISLISNEFLGEKAQFSFAEGIIGVIQSRDPR